LLDLKLVRDDPEGVKAALARRGEDATRAVDELLELDQQRRELLPEIEGRRAKQNEANDAIATAKREGGDAADQIAAMREIAGEVKKMESKLAEVEAMRDEVALTIPNVPDPDAPDGETDEDAVVLREVGEPPDFGFEPRDHVELCEGSIDIERAARASGARFAYILGDLVMVELALVRYAIEVTRGEGHVPVIPPVLVREEALTGTGFFPGDREMIYEIPRDELFLVGTSEVSLAALHMGEILDPGTLPLRYSGFSTCFRREAGAAGKDTRGMFRVHQFDKVEMFSFVEPAESPAEHEHLLGLQEQILQALELPYRVVNIPVGDLGSSAAKKYDCEAWIPSQGRYREVTSCSNTTDYQARRLDCRYRPAAEQQPIHPHTLNGTAVAVGRTLIALIENGQREDGSIEVPKVLHGYGAPEKISPG
jgi:seryl-tRNA synthetase